MTKIEMGRVYRTRDGREVRIYATDGGNHADYVHGAIKEKGGGWVPYQWYSHGGYLSGIGDPRDLIEVKPRIKRDVWVNVYRGRETDWVTVHDEREDADADRSVPCVACVKLTIDVEEGEGL